MLTARARFDLPIILKVQVGDGQERISLKSVWFKKKSYSFWTSISFLYVDSILFLNVAELWYSLHSAKYGITKFKFMSCGNIFKNSLGVNARASRNKTPVRKRGLKTPVRKRGLNESK